MSLWDQMRRGVNRAAQEAEKQATIARLSMEINQTKGQVKDKLEEVGKITLGLYREGVIDHASLEAPVVEIGKLEAHISDLEGQIAALKSAPPSAGST